MRGPTLLLILVVVVACSPAPSGLPAPVDAWPVRTIAIDGEELHVVEAVDRSRGAQGLTDFGGLDGMLFDHGAEVDADAHGYWMRGVPIALEIAFFDADGVALGQLTMPTCADDCPLHHAPAPFRWALETPAGALPVAPGARLEVGAGP